MQWVTSLTEPQVTEYRLQLPQVLRNQLAVVVHGVLAQVVRILQLAQHLLLALKPVLVVLLVASQSPNLAPVSGAQMVCLAALVLVLILEGPAIQLVKGIKMFVAVEPAPQLFLAAVALEVPVEQLVVPRRIATVEVVF